MKTVDVRGLSCPEPLLYVQAALSKEAMLVLANEAHTVKNIAYFLDSKKRSYEIREVGEEYEIHVK